MLQHLCIALLALMLALVAPSVRAQSLLRDAETERFLYDISRPIFEAAGLNPASVQFYLVGDSSINAFVAGGQNIFVHSGLILNAEHVDQLLGVIAHETGHISGGHLSRINEGAKDAMGIQLLSMLLGATALAAGAGDAGIAIITGGQQAAMGKFFAFTRVQEASADQAGATFLEKSGISGRGFIEFFEKLRAEEYRYAVEQNEYVRTHPLTGDRIERLTQRVEASPYFNRPPDPAMQARFLRIKAKLAGYVFEPTRTFALYPETDTSTSAHYARAYAWHKQAFPDKAREEIEAALKQIPDDPYFLEVKGQILLESGRVQEAIPPLRRAVELAPNEPLIATLLGHALISAEDKATDKEAMTLLRKAVEKDHDNPFAWYQLGIAYARSGDEPRAALASAERFSLSGQPAPAAANARRAIQGLRQQGGFSFMTGQFMGGVIATIAAAAGLFFLTFNAPPFEQAPFTPAQEQRIATLTHDFLMTNPSTIIDSVKADQQRAAQQYLVSDRDQLETPFRGVVSGNPNGDVTIIEFADYRCPFCKRAHLELERLIENDPGVRIVHRMYPILDRGGEPLSMLSARAALAAGLQGRFGGVHQALYNIEGRMTRETFIAAIRKARLDETRLTRDMESEVVGAEIKKNLEIGRALSITGTPSFIIGDRLIPGYVEADRLQEAVDALRARQKEALPAKAL
jgi:predicted Zn-dependent protease/protein-disulfide isomerase